MIQIANGFLPLLSDDGQTCACGFNQVLSVALPSGEVTTINTNGEASAAGFHGQIAYARYLPNGRELVNGPITVPVEQYPGVNPTRAVANGHVVSSFGGQHFIDGGVAGYDTGQSNIDAFDGRHYGYKPQNIGVPWPFIVRNVETQQVAIHITEPIGEAIVWTAPNGDPWVFANLNGAAVLYNRAGMEYWGFPQGEFRGALSNGPDDPWAWTCGQIGADPFIYGRPFSALSGAPLIALQGQWWAGLAVVWKPSEGQWVVAGYYNGPGGTLYIDPAVSAPASIPIPPQPEPPSGQVFTIHGPLKSGDVIRIV